MFDVDLIGRTLGPYIVVSKVGQGGMAVVYKAYETSLDRFVAIKVLPPSLAMEAGFNARFEREAKAIAKLDHPNILPVYGYGHQEGLSYLIMRFVQAGTLKDKLHQPLELTYIVDIIKQIGRALGYAHQSGVIHRDIKPSNILMADEHWPLLTDFGLAKMMESPSHLTGTGVGIGTPAYMSPEQAQGLEVDARTDIYSLGIMFYEMVIGKVPYEAETPMAVALKHINAPLPLPSSMKSDLPDEIENVLLKALAKRPDDRFQKVSDMITALDAAVQGIKIEMDTPAAITETAPVRVEEPVNAPTTHEAPVPQPAAEEPTKVGEESSPTPVQPPSESVETKAVSYPPKDLEKKKKQIIPRARWIGAGVTAVLLIIAAVMWGSWKTLPAAEKVQPTATTVSAQPILPAKTETPLPSPAIPLPTATPTKLTFLLRMKSTSGWFTVSFPYYKLSIEVSKQVETSGNPSNASRDNRVFRLNQDSNLAYAGFPVSATHEVVLSIDESLEIIKLSLEAGCWGSSEVEILNAQVDPPVVVSRYAMIGCQKKSFSVSTDLLKTSSPGEVSQLDPPLPVWPAGADLDEGKYVVKCLDIQPPDEQLCMIKIPTGELVQLTRDFNYWQIGYSGWKTDGQQIYYYAQISDNTPWSTFVMDTDGSNITELVNTAEIAFSPDGQNIAYLNDCQVLLLINRDGTGQRSLNTPGVRCMGWIRWSPDGTRLVFIDAFDYGNRPPDIWVINQDGSGLQRLYTFDEAIWVHGLAWNPDGTEVGCWYENRLNNIPKGILLDVNHPDDPQPIYWDMPTWWTPAFWPQWGINN